MIKTILVTPPAKVAHYRPATTGRTKAPRSCSELGICQGRAPACKAECAAPVPQVNVTNAAAATTATRPDHPGRDMSPWDAIAFYGAVTLTSLLSVAVVGVGAGYVYALWAA